MPLISATPRTVSKTSAKGLFRLNDIAEHQAAGNFPSDKTLDLNFVNNATIGANAAPDDAIDFSRASQATFTDADGLIKYAPHNLCLQSEDMGTTWALSNTTVTTNATTAPDGTTTADKITENTSTGGHSCNITLFFTDPTGFTSYSAYFKTNGRDEVSVRLDSATTNYILVLFNISTGTITAQSDNGNGTLESSSITDVGNGWFRVTMSGIIDTSGSTLRVLNTLYNASASYTGDGSSGFFMWGVQVSKHRFVPIGNPYIKTTSAAVYGARLDHEAGYFLSAEQPQNLILDSETIANASSGWITTASTANSTDVPSGIVADNSTQITYTAVAQVYNIIENINAGETYTFSYYVKLGTKSNNRYAVYDDTANAFVVSSAINTSASASEWTRFSLTVTAPANCDQLRFYVDRADNATEYGTIFITGVQVEVGSTATTYNQTNGLPYYGSGATQNGLLIEEQRVNLVTNSEDFSSNSITTNVTVTTNQIPAPDGNTTADLMVEDSSNAAHRLNLNLDNLVGNKAYTFSVFVKPATFTDGRGLSLIHATIFDFTQTDFNLTDGTINFSNHESASITDVGNGWFRLVATETSLNSGTGRFRINFRKDGNNSYQGDGSSGVYLWGAQIEEGAFATSYIPTGGSTVTRSADLATMSTGSLPFTGYNQSEGTIHTRFTLLGLQDFKRIYQLSKNNTDDAIQVLTFVPGNGVYESIRNDGTDTMFADYARVKPGETMTHVLGYKENDVRVERLNGLELVDSHTEGSVVIPDEIDRLGLGVRVDSSNQVASLIMAFFRYYPRRLSDVTLATIRGDTND